MYYIYIFTFRFQWFLRINFGNILGFLTTIKNQFFAGTIADIVGLLFAGSPIYSYIVAGEFGDISESTIMVATFLISWVTVSILQIPGESYYFNKKYALLRNGLAFIFTLLGGYTISLCLRFIK